MRILLVTDSLAIGGAERHVVDLAMALRRHEHDVAVACSAGGVFARDLERDGIPLRVLGESAVKRTLSITYARRLRGMVRHGQFDLVHAHCYASSSAAAMATLGTSIPLVLTEHSEGIWKGRIARRVSGWTYRQAQYVTVVSTPIRQVLIDDYFLPPDRVRVIANGVAPVTPAPPCTGPAPGWKEGPLVGVVARLQPEKGVCIFLDSVERVTRNCPDARYVVVGDGPLRPALEHLAGRLGVADRVRFLGFRERARAMLPALDILAVPSLTEGAPLVVLEAMAAGVPIVATAVGGIPEQIRHGREGLLVAPGDPHALSEAILTLIHDPERAHRLAEAGRRRALVDFSYHRMLGEVEDVYRRAIGVSALGTVEKNTPADGIHATPVWEQPRAHRDA